MNFEKACEVRLYLLKLKEWVWLIWRLLTTELLYNASKGKHSNDHLWMWHYCIGVNNPEWTAWIYDSIWSISQVLRKNYAPATVPQFPCELSPYCSSLSSSWTLGTGSLPSALSTEKHRSHEDSLDCNRVHLLVNMWNL